MSGTIFGILGAALGVLLALRLVFCLNVERTQSYSGALVARDVTLLVAGSFAGMLATGELVPWAG